MVACPRRQSPHKPLPQTTAVFSWKKCRPMTHPHAERGELPAKIGNTCNVLTNRIILGFCRTGGFICFPCGRMTMSILKNTDTPPKQQRRTVPVNFLDALVPVFHIACLEPLWIRENAEYLAGQGHQMNPNDTHNSSGSCGNSNF